jgi:hypothetical protein
MQLWGISAKQLLEISVVKVDAEEVQSFDQQNQVRALYLVW